MSASKRWQVSWWSRESALAFDGNEPLNAWISGIRDTYAGGEEFALTALVTAETEAAAIQQVADHYPGFELRFCERNEAE